MRMTDLDLVRRSRNGDQAAFCELVDRHAKALYRLAFALVGNAPDADDVLQETFLGAFRQMAAFEERASVRTWLSRILVNQAARRHRSRGRQKAVSLEGIAEPGDAAAANGQTGASAGDPAVRLDVLETLDALSPEHRQVIVLRELQGMSYDEIADTLGIPRGTVESRLFRARRELRDRLRDYFSG